MTPTKSILRCVFFFIKIGSINYKCKARFIFKIRAMQSDIHGLVFLPEFFLVLKQVIVFFHFFLIHNLNFFLFLMQSHHFFFLQFPLSMLIFNIFLFSLQVINLCYKFFILTHDSLVVSLVKLYVFFEFFFQALDGRLEMSSFFDKLFLLIYAFHLFFAFFLYILSINLNDLGFQSFVVLHKDRIYINVILIHVADVILKRLDVIQITALVFVKLSQFFFHTVSFRD